MSKQKRKYYAIVRGHKPGIYDTWYGENGAEIQVKGFSNPLFKSFHTIEDAQSWIKSHEKTEKASIADTYINSQEFKNRSNIEAINDASKVIIYTDGGSLGNPGPGGYAAVIIEKDTKKEIFGGFRWTTNNRMELMACIIALKSTKVKDQIVLYSDSKYVVDAIEKGWAKKWQKNNWMRSKSQPAKNPDLWKKLLEILDKQSVEFRWVKGHADCEENERCDELAKRAAGGSDLPADRVFEAAYKKGKFHQ